MTLLFFQHDAILYQVLKVLNVYKHQSLSYCACLMVELHELNDMFYVKMFLKHGHTDQIDTLIMKGEVSVMSDNYIYLIVMRNDYVCVGVMCVGDMFVLVMCDDVNSVVFIYMAGCFLLSFTSVWIRFNPELIGSRCRFLFVGHLSSREQPSLS